MKSLGINENSKGKILLTATTLFAQKGFEGTSIRDICKKANINISMISYYWGGKKELYQSIMDDLMQKQKTYLEAFIDINTELSKLSKRQKKNMLYDVCDKIIDFAYSKISKDLMFFLFREQQNSIATVNSPVFNMIKKLISDILKKNEYDREVVLYTVFIISQIASPKIFSNLSLKQAKQKNFTEEDINIIKYNLKKYIDVIFE